MRLSSEYHVKYHMLFTVTIGENGFVVSERQTVRTR